MLQSLRSRLTYANLMATIAVFVALGGSSYAALRVTSKHVPKNALTGADIKNLTGKDVRNNSLTGADVKKLTSADVTNGRLLAKDFAPGQLLAGAKGDPGPKGDKGATGDTGPQGPPGPTDGELSSCCTQDVPPAGGTLILQQSATITTSSTGDLYVFGHANSFVNCTTACTIHFGLYVDGTPVPGSGRRFSAAAGAPVGGEHHQMSGILEDVPAGTHTVQVGHKTTSGTTAGGSASALKVGVIALGGGGG